MNVTGIIAEYNPFHNGHAYHIAESRRLTNADYIVVIMSGNFVQRGEPAIIDKFARTKMALTNGADLVIELPPRFSTGSAEYFAGGAVRILDNLGCITHLCFGTECGNIELIKETAEILNKETTSYSLELQKALKTGLTFPQAREQAVRACGHSQNAALLSSPNNILGIEYCKALFKLNSSIHPVTVSRIVSAYHSTDITQSICSATALRTHLIQENELAADALPLNVYKDMSAAHNISYPVISNDFSDMLHYQLLSLQCWQELTAYFDIPDVLAQRIFRLRYEFRDFESFTALVKTKNITELSVRRALSHILLQLKAIAIPSPYARILGFRKSAAPLLKELKTHANLPLISKPSEFKNLLQEDIFASQVYQSVVTKKFDAAPYDELRQSMILI